MQSSGATTKKPRFTAWNTVGRMPISADRVPPEDELQIRPDEAIDAGLPEYDVALPGPEFVYDLPAARRFDLARQSGRGGGIHQSVPGAQHHRIRVNALVGMTHVSGVDDPDAPRSRE